MPIPDSQPQHHSPTSPQARTIRARCFSRLKPGQLLDTTMDTTPDSIALDTTGDGTVDKVVPIEDKDKYIVGEDA